MNYITALRFARENRRHPTYAEAIFWRMVRNKKLLGLKFNRQFIFEYKLIPTNSKKYFIVDFYCHKLNLVIELDGQIHDYQPHYDQNRESILQGMGLKILRFRNEDILDNWSKIESTIAKELNLLGAS